MWIISSKVCIADPLHGTFQCLQLFVVFFTLYKTPRQGIGLITLKKLAGEKLRYTKSTIDKGMWREVYKIK